MRSQCRKASILRSYTCIRERLWWAWGGKLPERKQPVWLFWVKAITAVFGLVLAANEVLALVISDQSSLAPMIKYISFFTERAVCNPDVLTLEGLDVCLSRGGVEP